MSQERLVHVIGTGTIGEPLIGLLTNLKDCLGIDTVSFHKKTPLVSDRSKVKDLIRRGALLAADEGTIPKFEDMGMKVTYNMEEAIDKASVVIDCTPSGVGKQNKAEFYNNFKHNTLGFVAQGSEFGFGKPYARGINDSSLEHGKDQFVQVVSCNTHNIAVLLETLALAEGKPENLVSSKFVMMRRANDISQDGSFIPAPQAGKHDDDRFGTHHARDAYHLYKTLGFELNVFSSAIKVNTQYMHSIWFDIQVKESMTLHQAISRLRENKRIAVTEKRSANAVFSFGRDHGHFGRILNQTVVPLRSLTVAGDHNIVGFTFTPQDGNALLSSVAITTWYLYPDSYEEKINCLEPYFFDEI
jgi:glyceraldehyde-3-phosphate dehydrogenase (NAD(P))